MLAKSRPRLAKTTNLVSFKNKDFFTFAIEGGFDELFVIYKFEALSILFKYQLWTQL